MASRCRAQTLTVEIEAHRYSVPHALVGLVLEARFTDALVEVLHRGQPCPQ